VTFVEVANDGTTVIASVLDHLYRSTDGGQTFEPLVTGPQANACLTKADDTFYACGAWATDGYAAAGSRDLGNTWRRLLGSFGEVAGPLACPAGTPTHDQCEPLWADLAVMLGAPGPDAGAV